MIFQKYNPEKKDWNWLSLWRKVTHGLLSEVQSREEGLKQERRESNPNLLISFRSTIQRRMIETSIRRSLCRRGNFFQKYNPEKKDWNKSWRTIEYWGLNIFQKYNPEKKDWNLMLLRGNKRPTYPFRSTIQRRRIETSVGFSSG